MISNSTRAERLPQTEEAVPSAPNDATAAIPHPRHRRQPPTTMPRAVKSLLLVLAVGAATAVVGVAPAAAKTPCAQAVINDWFDNGVVDQRFPTHCYRDAIRQLPRDVETYSSAKDDIQRALLAVLRGGDKGGGK